MIKKTKMPYISKSLCSLRQSNRGFTFIEIIIGVSLSVVIFVILLSALRMGYRSQEKGNERAEIAQRMRIITDRITWLIRGIYPYSVSLPEGRVPSFSGKTTEAGFITTSTEPSGRPEDIAGLKWVNIFVDSDGLKFREKVFFAEDIFDNEGGTVYLFDPEVEKIEIKYLDNNPEKKTNEWISEWDPKEKSYLPAAIKANISFKHKGKEVLTPEFIIKIWATGQ